jgi:TolA-binding protein
VAADAGLATAQPWLLGAVGLFVLVATAWNVARAIGPSHYYMIGWKKFEKQDYTGAIPYFKTAVLLGGDSHTAAEGTFFQGASLLRLNRPGEAVEFYRSVIENFPDSIWVGESHYHVGYCLRLLGRFREAKQSFRYVMVAYPGDRWAGFAADQMKQMREQVRGRRRG